MVGQHHSRWAAALASDRVVEITSTANERVKHVARMRDNRARRRAGQWITDGEITTRAAIQAGWKLLGLFIRNDVRNAASLWDWTDEHHAEKTFIVHPTAMAKMAYGQMDSRVIGQFEHRLPTIAEFPMPDSGIILVLDRIEKPGNVGAIFRSADAAGVSAVVLCDGGDPSHPNAIRNSRGATMHLPAASGSADAIRDRLGASGYRMLAARLEDSVPIDDADLSGRCCVILGNEADGLGHRWGPSDGVAAVHIPMLGRVDSLNVSVTAALFAMEAARRARQTR